MTPSIRVARVLGVATRYTGHSAHGEVGWNNVGHQCHLSDTTSYLYGKGKVSALKTLRAGDFAGFPTTFAEPDAMRDQIVVAGQGIIKVCALYGQRLSVEGPLWVRRGTVCTQGSRANFSSSCPYIQVRKISSSSFCAPI